MCLRIDEIFDVDSPISDEDPLLLKQESNTTLKQASTISQLAIQNHQMFLACYHHLSLTV